MSNVTLLPQETGTRKREKITPKKGTNKKSQPQSQGLAQGGVHLWTGQRGVRGKSTWQVMTGPSSKTNREKGSRVKHTIFSANPE